MITERIKQARKMLKLSQKEFGDRLGVSRDVIANIENNRVDPQKMLIQHISNVFAISIKWLETGEGNIFDGGGASIAEAMRLFDNLKPEFQEYVLQQIESLLELQNASNKDSDK